MIVLLVELSAQRFLDFVIWTLITRWVKAKSNFIDGELSNGVDVYDNDKIKDSLTREDSDGLIVVEF